MEPSNTASNRSTDGTVVYLQCRISFGKVPFRVVKGQDRYAIVSVFQQNGCGLSDQKRYIKVECPISGQ